MVFESRRPFHPGRLLDAVEAGWFPGVRIKGIAWLASELEHSTLWDQSGMELRLGAGPRWWAATPPAEWPLSSDARSTIFQAWESPSGDRRQRLSILGASVDRPKLAFALEQCLLTDEEMAKPLVEWSSWAEQPDHPRAFRLAG